MAALDTNALVRFLVQDDAAQGTAAARLIGSFIEAGSTLFVPGTGLGELEWVLRSAFGFDKASVLLTMFRLLGSIELAFESESAVEMALAQFQLGTADLADCLHAALAGQAGESPLWTFDKAAASIEGTRLPT